MAGKLTARKVETAKPGKYEDGRGLRLVVVSTGKRHWVLRYTRAGRRIEMGLGSAQDVTLADARQKAADARKLLANGGDPLAAKRKTEAGSKTFREAAAAYVESKGAGWRNEKHRAQWDMTLREYCKPIADLSVDAISTEHVLRVLKSVWQDIPETASRLRGRIERVLDYARIQNWRTGENPARWRGHLDHVLPKPEKLRRGHHAAMAYADVPAFVGSLRAMSGVAPLALEFAILTAARTGEALGARWDEFDLDAKLWVIPAERMKAKKEHRVPLSDRAAAVVATLAEARVGEHVFPGLKRGQPLSNMAFLMLLRRMQVDVTAHGFRSAFRDWCGDATAFPREVAEAALAHAVGNKVEAAYRRGDALAKRRELMTAWADYCEAKPANVIRLERRG